jgi:NhaP-type Na+/H+ or K+/H+ antiporter
MTVIAILLVLVFGYSLVSERLERTVLTAPIVFTAAGILTPLLFPHLFEWRGDIEVLLQIAEIGLVLLLFTDASRTDLGVLNNIRALPTRLLSTGMLLTIVLGALAALVIFRHLSIWEAGILAAILAPTDAGLGQVIVNSPRVPMKIRQALNVEAGLNDGLSVPFLLFFIALGRTGATGTQTGLAWFMLEQLGFGALIGVGLGLVGGWSIGAATRRKSIAPAFEQLGLVTVPLMCAVASEAVHASMFIAAFVAGLAVQGGFKEAGKHSVEFAEGWGQLLNLSIFFLFGLMATRAWSQFTMAHVLYAVLSLTIVRMLPVALALMGSGLNRATVLFMGWFGPRGLASIVLGLVYLEKETRQPGESTIRLAVMVTVLMSIFAHGLSALPGMSLYATTLAKSNLMQREHTLAGNDRPS